ncbi:MAG TPA: hypothetical protein VIL20_10740 [Sandaracinaceae bacterium]
MTADITTAIPKQTRDELASTRTELGARIDEINRRFDQTDRRLDQTNDRPSWSRRPCSIWRSRSASSSSTSAR